MDGELVAHNVYHIVNNAERNVANTDEPHALTLACWCEPAFIRMGEDVAGRPVVVMNHHQRGLFCCSKHQSTGEVSTWAEVGTGPFSHIDECTDVVQPPFSAPTHARIYRKPRP